MYQDKLTSPAEIAKYIESGYVCASPSALCEPRAIVKAIGDRARAGELTGVTHHSIISQENDDFLSEELAGKYSYVSWFTSGAKAKEGIKKGYIDYMPCHYSEVPLLWREDMPKLDALYMVCSPMDKHGYLSLGVTCSEALAMIDKAKYIFVEVNPKWTRTHGVNFIHISKITKLCENEFDVPELASAPITPDDEKIGQMIADLVPNGATIQLGIGGIPNAVGAALMDKKDLGIHTEMFTDSMVDLIEAGVVTNDKKALHRGKSIAAFAWGSKKMYDFMDDNPALEMLPVDYINNPYTVGQMDNFISVNSCIEIDFLGQACAESIGYRNFSGSGGQLDFVRGCILSKGGKSFIAIKSTAKKGEISKIKPMLTPGSAVTTGKNDIDYVVTEFGVARLRGKTASQRAKALIEIAHPKFREELLSEAKKMNLLV